MRTRLILFILLWCCLSLPFTSWGQQCNEQVARLSPAMMVSVPAAAGGDTWSCADAALICESFDATGFDDGGSLSATKVVDGTGTVNEDYANTTGVGCDSVNTQSLYLDNADSASNAHVYWLSGSATDFYVNLWFKIGTVIESETYFIVIGDTACEDTALGCRTISPDGSLYDVVCWTHGEVLGTVSDLSYNTWYQAKVTYKYTATKTASVIINGVTLGPGTAHSWDPQYLCLQATDPQSDNFSVIFDAVKASATSMPTCDAP